MTERDVVLNAVFVYWIDGLVGGNKIAIEMREATKENLSKVVRYSTEHTFGAFEAELKAVGIEDVEALYFDFLEPGLLPFLKEWNRWVSEQNDRGTEGGAAGVLKMLEDMIHKQIGYVSREDLQEQWDAVTETSEVLLLTSREYREHVKNIIQKNRRYGYIKKGVDIENLYERVFNDAVESAKHDTGPAKLKQRGKNARKPKKLEDAFGYNFVTENMKKVLRPEKQIEKINLSPAEKKAILKIARSRCAPLQFEYFRLHIVDGLGIREIAALKGKCPSTISKSIKTAKKRMRRN